MSFLLQEFSPFWKMEIDLACYPTIIMYICFIVLIDI